MPVAPVSVRAGVYTAHRRLYLTRANGGALVVLGQLGRLAGDTLEQVVHERVHNRHCFR
jgi:hypothetical protein